ncbi:hypothetical protein F3J22_13650 [Chitinophaga sp. Cy-1792]|nr:hypothetical protein [Chitinophaga sp. Cy-1792]
MKDISPAGSQVGYVESFHDLIATPYSGQVNALCWKRELAGDFSEIVHKIALDGNITVVEEEELRALQLSEQGNLAREILLNDMLLLEEQGASPLLNVISYYERDVAYPFFPTDVYSWHVDRAPIPTSTFLCTYYGESSDILPNAQGIQKILIPEIRAGLEKLYNGPAEGFEAFLTDNFFDLHYQAVPDAQPINCGIGNLWRLAVDAPGSKVPPCLHRAPREKPGESRLLLIC